MLFSFFRFSVQPAFNIAITCLLVIRGTVATNHRTSWTTTTGTNLNCKSSYNSGRMWGMSHSLPSGMVKINWFRFYLCTWPPIVLVSFIVRTTVFGFLLPPRPEDDGTMAEDLPLIWTKETLNLYILLFLFVLSLYFSILPLVVLVDPLWLTLFIHILVLDGLY